MAGQGAPGFMAPGVPLVGLPAQHVASGFEALFQRVNGSLEQTELFQARLDLGVIVVVWQGLVIEYQ